MKHCLPPPHISLQTLSIHWACLIKIRTLNRERPLPLETMKPPRNKGKNPSQNDTTFDIPTSVIQYETISTLKYVKLAAMVRQPSAQNTSLQWCFQGEPQTHSNEWSYKQWNWVSTMLGSARWSYMHWIGYKTFTLSISLLLANFKNT